MVAVRDNPDSVVRTDTPVQDLRDVAGNHHIVGVGLHTKVLVEVLKGLHLVGLMVHFDLVMVVHLESALVSGMVHQLIKVKKLTLIYSAHW